MATSPPNSNTGKPSDQRAEFMLIKISYDCQLLLPIKEGNEFLAAYSQARAWKSGYKEPTTIEPSPPEVTVRYVTKAEIAKVRFDQTIGESQD